MSILSTLAGIGMAVGPPLIYADQAYSIVKKKDSSGFSHDVCGVLLIANTVRVFFWLGNRFETPLLIQSLLLIVSQLILLAICLHYKPLNSENELNYAPLSPLPNSPNPGHSRQDSNSDYLNQPHISENNNENLKNLKGFKGLFIGGNGKRPFEFWQWEGYGNYLEFLAGLILFLGILQIILGKWNWYIDSLGFIALTIESTLPIPQFISNFRRKTCYGFRSSTLAGWFFGDAYKTVYFFLRGSPFQFKVTAIMTLCWDSAVLAQRVIYGAKAPNEASSQYSAPAQQEESRGLRANDERQFSIS
ncbi:uncharacterized protein I206_107057 [Kwoniella pini CBS 10737]|uniref:PQ-loop repeat-containing protein 1 n=1 Tax=Kwoniella pini CBS 10737 TaxID=1296096 RepID=A0A1B9HZD8_9TREE|nr:uncharacterized protein I206_05400 [Kwoniella pini CBS 10737]OCF48620.1 hypothetical protein I206_05400 [Kwoniella pini CBS 10737]